MENKQRKIEKLQAEHEELHRIYSRLRCMKRKLEITSKIFHISQQLRKLGAYNTKEYRQAAAAAKKYCKEQNAKLDAKNETKAKRKSKSKIKKRKRHEETVHFLHDKKMGILCGIYHK